MAYLVDGSKSTQAFAKQVSLLVNQEDELIKATVFFGLR